MASRIAPCLWFDGKAEEAARFYVSLLPDSRIDTVMPSPVDWPAGKAGDTVMVAFTLAGQRYQALNGGPGYPPTQAVSFSVDCADQAEIDRLWEALTADGGAPVQCGWLTDRYGFSWQIVPQDVERWLTDPRPDAAKRMMTAMFDMQKLDMAELKRALDGG